MSYKVKSCFLLIVVDRKTNVRQEMEIMIPFMDFFKTSEERT